MESSPKPSFIERLSSLLSREPEDRDDLVALMRAAFERALIDADALAMIEGTLQFGEKRVDDVMVSRARMHCVRLGDPIERIADFVIDTGHSRFPVIGEGKDDLVGILLAKDLLRHFVKRDFELRRVLRPPMFVPETKRLNELLRDFRVSRNHMAVVVDEYGGVSGLLTIEDVLEQIVGDIEDEFDLDDMDEQVSPGRRGRYRVKATMEIADFNRTFGTSFSDAEYDTVGGLVIEQFGRLPRRGDATELDGLKIQVLHADSRRLHVLLVEPPPSAGPAIDFGDGER